MEKKMLSHSKSRARRAGALALVTALATLPFSSACGRVQDDNASVFLIINTLEGISGAQPDKPSAVLDSDVVTKGTVWEDGGSVKFDLGLKAPSTTAPTATNFVTLTGYHVEFSRVDGGPVPAAFDGAFTLTVNASGATGGFTLVPFSAKLAKPLSDLVGSAVEIQSVATITFFGKDQNGRTLQVVGRISVNFADWADPT